MPGISSGSLTALQVHPMNKDTATLPPLQLSHSSPARDPDMADNMSIDKQDPTKEERESEDSMESSPEGEAPATAAAQENQQPKRKGGRKPVCECLKINYLPYFSTLPFGTKL